MDVSHQPTFFLGYIMLYQMVKISRCGRLFAPVTLLSHLVPFRISGDTSQTTLTTNYALTHKTNPSIIFNKKPSQTINKTKWSRILSVFVQPSIFTSATTKFATTNCEVWSSFFTQGKGECESESKAPKLGQSL